MIKAKFIDVTFVGNRGGDSHKHRWECPKCRADPNMPECRFNLSPKKDGKTHKCRFCGTELKLER